MIGVAKELAESVAKSVLVARGEAVSSRADFSNLVDQAHKTLKRQPGVDLTNASPLRAVAQGAKGIVTQLGEIRNGYGTGHGRAQEPTVTEEVLHLSMDATLLWCRWALRRLGVLAHGMPAPLIRDLEDGGRFTSGLLATRLVAADLTTQHTDDPAIPRRVGLAVAQRAMRGTFVVQGDGIEACAAADDPTTWPDSYREGAFEGLFLSTVGTRTLDTWSAEWAPRLIAPIADPTELITALTSKVSSASPHDHHDYLTQQILYRALDDGAGHLPAQAYNAWHRFAEIFQPDPFAT